VKRLPVEVFEKLFAEDFFEPFVRFLEVKHPYALPCGGDKVLVPP
jgi:hypothetical protein